MIGKAIILVLILFMFSLVIYWSNNEPYIAPSSIHGMGLFANKMYMKGEKILLCVDENSEIIEQCRKINHCPAKSSQLNTVLVKSDDNEEWWIIATRTIRPNEELSADYMKTPSFIKKADKNWKC
jgi:SET domain